MRAVRHRHRFSAGVDAVWAASLSVALHTSSLASSGEQVLDAPAHDRLRLGDEVTWRARYLGRRWTMRVRVTEVDEPVRFEAALRGA